MKTVHVIFKTHLDVGFTDFASHVFRKYCDSYIPQALSLAREMRESGRPERFVWTVGSWLVYEYLEQADTAARRRMESGIAHGDMVWHALPFTTHTELMDASLFRFGLSLARDLDRRFGRRTIAAKMTDVPGHTRAIVPLLAAGGVRFLHIGVNPVCKPPQVPPVFRWQAPDGSELLVAYSSGYGSAFAIPGFQESLTFAHTGDNLGPPPAAEIKRIFDEYRTAYPGATVQASTLDAFARRLLKHRDKLPVVTAEIGDTWIHGGGSDPRKIASYRALCRLRNTWEENGLARRYASAFRTCSRHLMVVPEHTWGLDIKTNLCDYRNYRASDFARARARDLVPASAVPAAYARFAGSRPHAPFPQRYSTCEASWDEQRGYVRDAVRALSGTPLGMEARQALRDLQARRPSLKGFVPLRVKGTLSAGAFTIALDRKTGALTRLRPARGGASVSDAHHPIGLFRYQTLSQGDYDRRLREYCIKLEEHASWAIPDLSKPGMDDIRPRPRHALVLPNRVDLRIRRGATSDVVLAMLTLPDRMRHEAGAPHEVMLRYTFPHDQLRVELDVFWFEKPATRLPVAIWLSFQPIVAQPRAWQIEKMGAWFSPLEVIENGNRKLHAVGRAIRNAGLTVETLDAPLVAPGTPQLLEFSNTQPDLAGGMHINLYNNVWGTNFPMWNEDDARFRFVVRFDAAVAGKA